MLEDENTVTAQMLINTLKDLDPDTLIVLAQDSEGNSYSPMASYSKDDYIPSSPWQGEIYFMEMGEKPPEAVPCVVLWPTN